MPEYPTGVILRCGPRGKPGGERGKTLQAPVLSIGIPTVSRLALLEEAVDSARAQSRADIEIVVAQDSGEGGLDPAVSAYLDGLRASDARVVVVKHPARMGLAGNWNSILEAATGDFVALIGDDDRLLPGFAETLVARALVDESDIVFSDHWVIDALGDRLAGASDAMSSQYGRAAMAKGPIEDPGAAVWRNSVPLSACVMRTSLMRTLQFRQDLNCPEIEAFARAVNLGAKFSYVDARLAEYRVHARSATARGLSLERLFWYLHDIPTPTAAGHEAKTRFLRSIAASAINIEISHGHLDSARRILRSPFLALSWAAFQPRVVKAALRLAVASAMPRAS